MGTTNEVGRQGTTLCERVLPQPDKLEGSARSNYWNAQNCIDRFVARVEGGTLGKYLFASETDAQRNAGTTGEALGALVGLVGTIAVAAGIGAAYLGPWGAGIAVVVGAAEEFGGGFVFDNGGMYGASVGAAIGQSLASNTTRLLGN